MAAAEVQVGHGVLVQYGERVEAALGGEVDVSASGQRRRRHEEDRLLVDEVVEAFVDPVVDLARSGSIFPYSETKIPFTEKPWTSREGAGKPVPQRRRS
ncbi:hypothetical protein [Streptomonospora sp. PA3]|uniref:hypothetical protein n=1 Tax=Streptomonospora sp. PA3 TaxID=2607326 RepID=UPI0031B9F9E1